MKTVSPNLYAHYARKCILSVSLYMHHELWFVGVENGYTNE